MLTTNTMRYGTDEFDSNISGLITPNIAWNFSSASSVDGFTIEGTQPVGTDRRAVFIIDETAYKLSVENGVGTPVVVTGNDVDVILEEGNTMAELASVTSIPAWVGKKVTPCFAMYMPQNVPEAPTLKVGIKYAVIENQYAKTEISDEISLADEDVLITDVTISSLISAGNTVEVMASLYNGSAWGEYVPIESIIGLSARKIKIKAVCTVLEIGVGEASLNKVVVYHRDGNQQTSSVTSTVITNTHDLGMTARHVRASIVHDTLKDAVIRAYASLRSNPSRREYYQIGTATGESQTIALTDSGIDPESIKLWSGTNRVYSFDFNLVEGTITLAGTAGTGIYASYDYGFGMETWIPMTADGTQVYDKDKMTYNSAFSYSVPANEAGKNIAAVKFELARTPGTAEEPLGTANGVAQMFYLSHNADAETISIPGAEFSASGRLVTLAAASGTNLVATYDYDGTPPVCHSYAIAWNE